MLLKEHFCEIIVKISLMRKKNYFHFSYYTPIETLSFHKHASNGNKNTAFVEVSVINNPIKFQFYSPYSFLGADIQICFRKLNISVAQKNNPAEIYCIR